MPVTSTTSPHSTFEMPRGAIGGRSRFMGVVAGILLGLGLGLAFGPRTWSWAFQAWTAPPATCQPERVAHEFQLEQCKKFSDRRNEMAAWALLPLLAAFLVTMVLNQRAAAAYAAANREAPGGLGKVAVPSISPGGLGNRFHAWSLCLRWVQLEDGKSGWQPQTDPAFFVGQAVQMTRSERGKEPWLKLHAPQMVVVRGKG